MAIYSCKNFSLWPKAQLSHNTILPLQTDRQTDGRQLCQ